MQVNRLPVPSRMSAAALATCGYALKPKAYRNDLTGEMSVQWFCDSRVLEAHDLLDSAASADPAKRLAAVSPEHPYLVCLYLQEAADSLTQWLRKGHLPVLAPAGISSRLLRLLPPSPQRTHRYGVDYWAFPRERKCRITEPLHAAAAAVCGFIPQPQLDLRDGVPGFIFDEASATFPGLTLSDLRRAGPLPGAAKIGDYAAGEHPACYALQCAVNLRSFAQAEQLVLKNPVHMLRGRGTRSALMSEGLLSAKDHQYRDRLRKHLAGLT